MAFDVPMVEAGGWVGRLVYRGYAASNNAAHVSAIARPDGTAPPVVSYYRGGGERSAQVVLLPDRHDPAPVLAFCLGRMPAPVFADWLEEASTRLPADACAVLRGW